MSILSNSQLPDSNCPDLVLKHPTPKECITIWNNTSDAWVDSLTVPLYLEESEFLTTVPLAKNGGMTNWILVLKDAPPGKRRILCSCESFRKRSLTSDAGGRVSDNIVHGIASVFTPVPYRHQGYASRMMQELAKRLYTWQTDEIPCAGTTLYSDIGKELYTNLGWLPNATNSHVDILPGAGTWPPSAIPLSESDLQELCKKDELLIRSQMAAPTREVKVASQSSRTSITWPGISQRKILRQTISSAKPLVSKAL